MSNVGMALVRLVPRSQIEMMHYYMGIVFDQVISTNQAISENLVDKATAKNMRANTIKLYEGAMSYIEENDLDEFIMKIQHIHYINQMIYEWKNGLI